MPAGISIVEFVVVVDEVTNEGGLVRAAQLPVLAGALSPSLVEVQCGTGGRGTLTLEAPAGSCPNASLEWSALSGPEVRFSNKETMSTTCLVFASA